MVSTQASSLVLHRASLVRALSPAEEGIAQWARWGGRLTDFAVVTACMTLLPVLAWVAVRLHWRPPGLVRPRSIALWILVAVGSWSAALTVSGPRNVWVLPLLDELGSTGAARVRGAFYGAHFIRAVRWRAASGSLRCSWIHGWTRTGACVLERWATPSNKRMKA
jgi:hypothetical protein